MARASTSASTPATPTVRKTPSATADGPGGHPPDLERRRSRRHNRVLRGELPERLLVVRLDYCYAVRIVVGEDRAEHDHVTAIQVRAPMSGVAIHDLPLGVGHGLREVRAWSDETQDESGHVADSTRSLRARKTNDERGTTGSERLSAVMANAGPGQVGDALLERGTQLAALAGMLAEVRASSSGRLVAVGGEAGVGKTALLQCFCRAEVPAGHVLWGACAPLRTPRPLGPLVDVADGIGGEFEQVVTAAGRPYEVVGALLRELRRGALTVLVLEDLQWADEATIDVLALLSARIATAPALVLVSYRDDELDRTHQLRVVLGEMVRAPGRIRVDPLSRMAVAELAGPHHVDVETLYARTGGNPFFVTEVLATERQTVPETVRDAVLARAARLSDGARGLLDAISVIPGGCELDLLDQLAGNLLENLGECIESRDPLRGRREGCVPTRVGAPGRRRIGPTRSEADPPPERAVHPRRAP